MKSQPRKFRVRPARTEDSGSVAKMCAALWPDGSVEEHGREVIAKIEGRFLYTLPLAIFVAESLEGSARKAPLIGFTEVGLRSHADGCDESQPVGFLEGWYVDRTWRRCGVGAALVAAAENWCRSQGCKEMASDALIDNKISHQAHQALGYRVLDHCVHFRKPLL